MDRQFDYTQKILVAVEFAEAPRELAGLPGYARFKRLSIPAVIRAFDETHSLFVQLLAGFMRGREGKAPASMWRVALKID